jgi:hypothetical protein
MKNCAGFLYHLAQFSFHCATKQRFNGIVGYERFFGLIHEVNEGCTLGMLAKSTCSRPVVLLKQQVFQSAC